LAAYFDISNNFVALLYSFNGWEIDLSFFLSVVTRFFLPVPKANHFTFLLPLPVSPPVLSCGFVFFFFFLGGYGMINIRPFFTPAFERLCNTATRFERFYINCWAIKTATLLLSLLFGCCCGVWAGGLPSPKFPGAADKFVVLFLSSCRSFQRLRTLICIQQRSRAPSQFNYQPTRAFYFQAPPRRPLAPRDPGLLLEAGTQPG